MIDQQYFSGEPFGGSLLYGKGQTGQDFEEHGMGPGFHNHGLGFGFEEIPEMPLDALEGPQFDYYS